MKDEDKLAKWDESWTPPKDKPKEIDIESSVCEYAESLGMRHYKIKFIGKKGAADRMFIRHGGFIFFMEFKQPGETPNTAQVERFREMNRLHCLIFFPDSVESGKEVIDLVNNYPLSPLHLFHEIGTAIQEREQPANAIIVPRVSKSRH